MNRLLALMLAGAALAVGACGDDEEEESGPTKAEFIERADAICREGEEKAEELGRTAFENPDKPTGGEVLAVLEELIPIQRDVIDRVRELERPEGDEAEIERFLTLADEALSEVETIDDPRTALAFVQATETPDDPFYEADRGAREYGLKVCGD